VQAPCVLVVEDEPLIRLDVVDTFEKAGCSTIVAATAEEAVGAVLEYPSLGALFTDITLPGQMDGLELAHVVKRLRPKAKIILSSGNTLPRAADLPAGARFIAKPVRPELLQEIAQEVCRAS
jgi:CheY-like chemotaxis protein